MWDEFNAWILADPDFDAVSRVAFEAKPMLAASLPTALSQVQQQVENDQPLASFEMAFTGVCQLGGATKPMVHRWAQKANDIGLPEEFIRSIKAVLSVVAD